MIMRFANKDEAFRGIGMDKPMMLAGGEVVIADDSRLLVIYPQPLFRGVSLLGSETL